AGDRVGKQYHNRKEAGEIRDTAYFPAAISKVFCVTRRGPGKKTCVSLVLFCEGDKHTCLFAV
ncbi:MAG: hypothetical protein LWW91_09135, partial [Bacteroidales bacterium]|nr:hypothetical protein [Bacteroidales bacterium]